MTKKSGVLCKRETGCFRDEKCVRLREKKPPAPKVATMMEMGIRDATAITLPTKSSSGYLSDGGRRGVAGEVNQGHAYCWERRRRVRWHGTLTRLARGRVYRQRGGKGATPSGDASRRARGSHLTYVRLNGFISGVVIRDPLLMLKVFSS